MSACILHVGMMKTGTSSIQKSLNGFADAGFVCYQDGKGRTNHTPTVFGIVGAVKPGKGSGQKVPEVNARESFDEAIRSLGQRSLIVSGEGMLRLSSTQIREVAGYFRTRNVRRVTIAAYVRPPVGYVTSLARATKGGMLRRLPLDTFVNYRKSFEKFDQVFGRENVSLWKFDPRSFPSGCVVQDFSSKLGIDFPAERVVRENESLSLEAVSLLYTYYRLGKELGSRSMRPAQRYLLVRRLAAIGQKKLRFSPDLVRPFLELNRADIEWMEQRLGQSLDEDWSEHQPGDVREDWDLLRHDPEVVDKLRELLGGVAPTGVKGGESPEEVALLVHALRGEPASKLGAGPAGWIRRARKFTSCAPDREANALANDADLIGQMQQTHPQLLNGIPPQQARLLVSYLFKHIQDNLARTEQGIVGYAGLGSFRVRKVEKEVNGAKSLRTRIGFRPAAGRSN